jgi:hypothetical protein
VGSRALSLCQFAIGSWWHPFLCQVSSRSSRVCLTQRCAGIDLGSCAGISGCNVLLLVEELDRTQCRVLLMFEHRNRQLLARPADMENSKTSIAGARWRPRGDTGGLFRLLGCRLEAALRPNRTRLAIRSLSLCSRSVASDSVPTSFTRGSRTHKAEAILFQGVLDVANSMRDIGSLLMEHATLRLLAKRVTRKCPVPNLLVPASQCSVVLGGNVRPSSRLRGDRLCAEIALGQAGWSSVGQPRWFSVAGIVAERTDFSRWTFLLSETCSNEPHPLAARSGCEIVLHSSMSRKGLLSTGWLYAATLH